MVAFKDGLIGFGPGPVPIGLYLYLAQGQGDFTEGLLGNKAAYKKNRK